MSCDITQAVEVGFEPTEGLPLHTLSRTAQRHPPTAVSVPNLARETARVRR